ncbi:[protein-PII] uridylyltransferase [Oleiagrimonas sp. C23AA]|uniref:[protein-PII] uridylyltransferase n=1 Tax=Oleiagrimonas sp. C23AA TaxID=2719047 RepID=UPI00142007CA|nr:[protein-PII] uridylyltransferase [Oleiagrimonas sp. C23AA]NII12357.1 [protein-PII] uridylyltransferase [Oleiagrimonas sp. C23AA]
MTVRAIPLPTLPRLPIAVPRSGVSEQARLALRQLLDDADRAFAAAFNSGADATVLVHRRSDIVERVVIHVWRAFLGEAPGCALLAVGGFGRGLLFPHSDVDLLVMVTPESGRAKARALERFFACLWDLGLKPGHAVRDAAQCRELAGNDVSVFTSLLDARRLAGDADQVAKLKAMVDDESIWPPPAFLAAKQAEQAQRHAKHNDTAHNLEPNLKEGPGGMRTLDLMRWLARRVAGVIGFDGMLAAGLLDPAEREALAEAEATLRRYRVALHLEAGRAEERLLFDYQRPLAMRLGFEDEHEKNLGVEQFMQGYYRAATVIERLGVQLGERFEELLEPDVEPRPLNAHFVCLGKRLQPVDPDLFLRQPDTLIEAFSLRLAYPDLIGFTAETMRRIQQAVAHLGESMGDDEAVLAAFLALLRRGAPAVEALWRMNRFGLLAAVLPAFGDVVGRMQYDLFHVYTVDEHTLRVLHNVARFADPDARREFPLCCEIWHELDKPELLLLAALFHDIAKGRGGDHSVLGEDDARAFCTRLGLPQADINMVAWLVRWHLLMSTTAQRQDITDADVVHRFATEVGDWEHLDHLYLLTVADIIGTSPKLWNAWKDRLLADLYVAARYALRSDLALPLRAEVRVRDCRERALKILTSEGFDADAVAKVWVDFPDLSFLRHRAEQVAWQTAAILRADGVTPLVEVHPFSVRGSTELFVYAPDRDGLFATVTAMLDRLRFSVVEARILGSRTGMALDTFLLLESDNQHVASPERASDLKSRLARALAAPARAQPAKRGLSRQLRHFQMAPRVEYTDDASTGRTQLALVCSDRPGLLAAVAQAFVEAGVRVHDARIATFGERVEDFFQLTGPDDGPLDADLKHTLRGILERRIGGPASESLPGNDHANA